MYMTGVQMCQEQGVCFDESVATRFCMLVSLKPVYHLVGLILSRKTAVESTDEWTTLTQGSRHRLTGPTVG